MSAIDRSWYRLYVSKDTKYAEHVENNAHRCSIFDLRDLTTKSLLITGRGWGDDYLQIPLDEAERKTLEEIINLSQWSYEIVAELPHHLKCYA